MTAFLRSTKAGLKDAAVRRFVRYACALSQFKEGGPPNAKAVGDACGQPKGAVNELLNDKKDPWSAAKVRHKLGMAALRGRIDGIVICHFFTSYAPGYTIITAHAFAGDYRILIGARRSKRPAHGPEEDEDLQRAYHSLVAEVYYLLSHLSPSGPVPILTESRFVGQAAVASLVASELDYLVELTPSWSDGGLVAADPLPLVHRTMDAGTSLRGLFPLGAQARPDGIDSCPVVLKSWNPNLGNWAVVIGEPGPEQRYFLGRMSSPDQFASGSEQLIEDRVRHWATEDLEAKAWANYGLELYHAPSDAAFDRHCTALTLRDAYQLNQRSG
jgi:hypothetical protein